MRVAPVASDVVGAVDVHEQRDDRDDQEHHHAQPVDERADGELLTADLEPRDLGGDRVDRVLTFGRCVRAALGHLSGLLGRRGRVVRRR